MARDWIYESFKGRARPSCRQHRAAIRAALPDRAEPGSSSGEKMNSEVVGSKIGSRGAAGYVELLADHRAERSGARSATGSVVEHGPRVEDRVVRHACMCSADVAGLAARANQLALDRAVRAATALAPASVSPAIHMPLGFCCAVGST